MSFVDGKTLMSANKEVTLKELDQKGAAQLAKVIQLGIRRSALHKLVEASGVKGDVKFYVDWMMGFSTGQAPEIGELIVPVLDILKAQDKASLNAVEVAEIKIVSDKLFG